MYRYLRTFLLFLFLSTEPSWACDVSGDPWAAIRVANTACETTENTLGRRPEEVYVRDCMMRVLVGEELDKVLSNFVRFRFSLISPDISDWIDTLLTLVPCDYGRPSVVVCWGASALVGTRDVGRPEIKEVRRHDQCDGSFY